MDNRYRLLSALPQLFRRRAADDAARDTGETPAPEQDNADGHSGMYGSTQGSTPAKRMTQERVLSAQQTLIEYKRGKASLDARIVADEAWWRRTRGDSYDTVDESKARNVLQRRSTSAWLFNAIANKHADAMDNYPEPVILPREQSDEQAAQVLSDVLPAVLEYTHFDDVYSSAWWYKLKTGTACYGVFWDSRANSGVGEISIRKIDLLNLFWEPGVTDIQDSRNLFLVTAWDNDALQAQYPQLTGKLGSDSIDVVRYMSDDYIDVTSKTLVVDWYYKMRRDAGSDVLHYCKFAAGQVLYASEDDPQAADAGFYDHAQYPFVFDALFPMEDTPAGYGYIDVCKAPQAYIDDLDTAILRTAMMSAQPRFFVRKDGSINDQEFADWGKTFVNYSGVGMPQESIMQMQMPSLQAAPLNVRAQKIDELKETSGNRDFSQGGTSGGVTAASAIAALQEAGSKLSRDMIKSSYRAFARINTLCIELMRQFYTETRYFRILGKDGQMQYAQINAAMLGAQPQESVFGLDLGSRLPVFDVRVISQKSSPFAVAAQNERAKELYAMGFFAPNNADQSLAALEMMDFEGIEKVRERVAQNGTLYDTVQQLQAQMMQLAQIVDAQNGSNITQGIAQGAQATGISARAPDASQASAADTRTNVLGDPMQGTAGAARLAASQSATPK